MTKNINFNQQCKEHIYGEKALLVQNGDFSDIKNILSNFHTNLICVLDPMVYSEENIFVNSVFKQIDHPILKVVDCNFKIDIVDKKILQIIQINISHIFNTNLQKICYLPVYKNVVFEKKCNKYIAIYFIILNLFNTKNNNGVLKLISK